MSSWFKAGAIRLNQISTLLIARCGAVLFAYDLRNNSQLIEVKHKRLPIDGGGRKPTIELRAVNVGSEPVTLCKVGAKIPDSNNTWIPVAITDENKLPKRLGDGESISISLELHDLGEYLALGGYSGKIVLHPFFIDDAGNKYWDDKLVVEAASHT